MHMVLVPWSPTLFRVHCVGELDQMRSPKENYINERNEF